MNPDKFGAANEITQVTNNLKMDMATILIEDFIEGTGRLGVQCTISNSETGTVTQ